MLKHSRVFVVIIILAQVVDAARPKHQEAAKETLPLVIATWEFSLNATNAAWEHVYTDSGTAVDSVVIGCSVCEENHQCGESIGYGGNPDEHGETELDAMIMDGKTHNAAAVGGLRSIKNAIGVAHAVLKYTTHTMLVGSLATDFAVSMGFPFTNLSTQSSVDDWQTWKDGNCQPNFRQNVTPDPSESCGPYSPITSSVKHKRSNRVKQSKRNLSKISNNKVEINHDTIGMMVIDKIGNIGGGTSTNGLSYKIPGRVGDSPIIGSGTYVDNEVGGAAGTGNGDIMMRFVPSFHAVELMRGGMTPTEAARTAIDKIVRYYPTFRGAILAVSMNGFHGAACHGYDSFPYTVRSPDYTETQFVTVDCT